MGSHRSLGLVGSAATVGARGGAAPDSGVTYPEEGYDAIPGDGLQEAGGSSETLQPSPTRGEERANDNDPRGRPRQGANHQVPVDSLTKPAGHQHHLWFHPMTEPRKHQHHSGTTQPSTTTALWGDVTQQGKGPPPRGVSNGAGSEVARALSSSLYPLARPRTRAGVGRDSSSLCRGGSDDACSWILFVLVLATQKCHLPRAVIRAAPDRQEHRQLCLLTNKWLPAAPEREKCSKTGMVGGCTQTPSACYKLQSPFPETPTSPPSAPMSAQCVLVAAFPTPLPGPGTVPAPACSRGLPDPPHAPHGLGTLTCRAGRRPRCMLQRGQQS